MQAVLFEVPRTPQDWDRWGFHHRASHDQIRSAIQAKDGVNLNVYQFDPINPGDFGSFLERNTEAHTDMNGALGLPGVDLEELDPQDEKQLVGWIWRHALEHRTAEDTLGIGS